MKTVSKPFLAVTYYDRLAHFGHKKPYGRNLFKQSEAVQVRPGQGISTRARGLIPFISENRRFGVCTTFIDLFRPIRAKRKQRPNSAVWEGMKVGKMQDDKEKKWKLRDEPSSSLWKSEEQSWLHRVCSLSKSLSGCLKLFFSYCKL